MCTALTETESWEQEGEEETIEERKRGEREEDQGSREKESKRVQFDKKESYEMSKTLISGGKKLNE